MKIEHAVPLVPVERDTVQDRVYHQLRQALISGDFQPGQILTVRGLASALGTSTMPIREALGRLASEKALEPMHNRSVRVPPASIDRLDDLLRTRILIEGEATAVAAKKMAKHELQDVRRALHTWEKMRASGSRQIELEVRLNQAFHFAIYRGCGSPSLIPMIESLWLQSGPYTRYAISSAVGTGDLDTSLYHRKIAEALFAKNAAKAKQLLVADISHSFTYLRKKLKAAREPYWVGTRRSVFASDN